MARFDEASNIDWAKKMQEAGIRVIFGVEGLKVHAKLTHDRIVEGRHRLREHGQLPRRQRPNLH
ncbi:MAG: hypothetical protein ACLR76_07230 [Alistipes sp.]